jgi:Kef-type K+ transport system membrane component KefB
MGLLGLALLTSLFRPASTWLLPGPAWLFITFGLPACIGCVVYMIFRLPASSSQSIAMLLGAVAFTAGMASELRLSAVVVCFFVGVLLANFPGDYHARLQDKLEHLEAPIYLLFLVVAGALWDPSGPLGWALMVLFVVVRFGARWAGARLVWRRVESPWPVTVRRALVLSPMGTLPIAIAVNAVLLYPAAPGLSAVVTSIIAGTFVAEFVAQLYWRLVPGIPPGQGEA